MSYFLGIDTSNYTTSVAIYDNETKKVIHKKKLLPVKPGERGIRQSDAVFHHTQAVRELIDSIFSEFSGSISAVACSTCPRWVEGSYMPCFTVGETVATSIAMALSVPLYKVSHQEGHIAAALYSASAMSLMGSEFLAFHVSGGTTEALLVTPDSRSLVACKLLASSSDLKAGQAIDRVGVMLGLQFPCGPELEKLASQCSEKFSVRVPVVDGSPSLSGVENQCSAMISSGAPAASVAAYCLQFVGASLTSMTSYVTSLYPTLPIVYSGGVMSNGYLQSLLASSSSYFATPEFSSDNAAGVAILAEVNFSND